MARYISISGEIYSAWMVNNINRGGMFEYNTVKEYGNNMIK